MTISKAVELLIKFIDVNPSLSVQNNTNIKIVENEFEKFLKLKHKNISEVAYKLNIAIANGFISINKNENELSDYINTTEKFAEYILKNESNRTKFIYGLVGSLITVVGGLIGALISVFI